MYSFRTKHWKTALTLGLSLLLLACAAQQPKSSSEEIPAPDPQANVREAMQYLKQDNPERALNKVLLALKEDPENVKAYNVAGLVYEKYGQPNLAGKYFRRAIELAPQSASVRNNYGKFLCTQQDFKQAEENFLMAAASQDSRATEVAYTNAGLCALRIPDSDRAAQYFRAALDANPRLAVPYYQMARINLEKQRYPQARRNLQSYTHYAAHTSKSLLLGIRIERALGNPQQEQQYARMLQERFPESPEIRELLLHVP
ncbi:MAG: type IV pilus biogenesis/stability protein PilW [Pseudomonadota bacterium]